MDKTSKKKEGIARLMELAGTKKAGLTAACTLSVLSSVCRIIPYFTIYRVLQMLISCYSSGETFTFASVRTLVLLTAASAVLYGVFAYASAMLSHGAAFDILYELLAFFPGDAGDTPYSGGSTCGKGAGDQAYRGNGGQDPDGGDAPGRRGFGGNV